MFTLATLGFIVATLIAVWIIFGNGAETGFGQFLADLISFAPESSELMIRVIVALGWCALLLWYLTSPLGLQFL